MFKLFKKRGQQTPLVAPADGQLLPMDGVHDVMFSQKMMGDGFGVVPEADELFAPATGEIISVFPTKHAYTMKTADGLELLVHLGVDTVELKGAPFALQITPGDEVTADAAIGTMNRQMVQDAGKATDVIVVVTNMDQISDFPTITPSQVEHGQTVATLTVKA